MTGSTEPPRVYAPSADAGSATRDPAYVDRGTRPTWVGQVPRNRPAGWGVVQVGTHLATPLGMQKTTTALATPLRGQLDWLATPRPISCDQRKWCSPTARQNQSGWIPRRHKQIPILSDTNWRMSSLHVRSKAPHASVSSKTRTSWPKSAASAHCCVSRFEGRTLQSATTNMSRQNKVNRNNYTQAGRLTPDDMARERHKQRTLDPAVMRDQVDRVINRAPEARPKPGGRGSNRARSAPEE